MEQYEIDYHRNKLSLEIAWKNMWEDLDFKHPHLKKLRLESECRKMGKPKTKTLSDKGFVKADEDNFDRAEYPAGEQGKDIQAQ